MAYQLLHTLTELPYTPATVDEETGYYITQIYESENPEFIKYTTDQFDIFAMSQLCNSFAAFTAKVKNTEGKMYQSYFPLGVFRYMLHEDLSYSNYYAPKRKPGYVVEGSYWSNGMFYQVREDDNKNLQIHQIVFYVDELTRKMSKYPKVDHVN
jgi:hypothetical protein